jgi:hypothetical protein
LATFQDLVNRARLTLIDPNQIRYTDSEMLTYALDGLREIAIHKPKLFEVGGSITLVAGVSQAIRPAGWFVIDVFENIGGRGITQCDLPTLRAFDPNWRTSTPGPTKHWMRYPSEPDKELNNVFYVYPRAVAGAQVSARWTELDTSTMAIGSTVPLPTVYEPALEAYIIFRAESKDDQHVLEQRAAAFSNHFRQILGLSGAAEIKVQR